MNVSEVIQYLVLGGTLGACGQGIRQFVTAKKTDRVNAQKRLTAQAKNKDTNPIADEDLNLLPEKTWKEIFILLFLGFIAGMLAMLLTINIEGKIMDAPNLINNKLLLGTLAAGYAGADFIENVMTTVIPRNK